MNETNRKTSLIAIAVAAVILAAILWSASGVLWHWLLVLHGRG